jgi:hypothetical protein
MRKIHLALAMAPVILAGAASASAQGHGRLIVAQQHPVGPEMQRLIARSVKAAQQDLRSGARCVRLTVEYREVNYARC